MFQTEAGRNKPKKVFWNFREGKKKYYKVCFVITFISAINFKSLL